MAITSRNENFWEQRKLGEVSKKLKSYSLTRSVESKTKTKIKYIHYGDIHTGIAQNITVNNKLPWIKLDQSKKIEKLKKGDIIVADASEDYKGIADAALIEESLPYHIIAGLHTIAFRPNNQLMDSKFIFYALQNISFKRYGYKIGTGLKVFGISTNNFFNFNLKFPNILEQNKISTLISKLKNLITLYDRKLKLLSQVKKYFLDNLFAEKEYPNLRFKGFTDAWEHRKLNSIFETVSKKGFPNLPVLTATQTKGMIYRNNSGIDIKFNENSLKNYKLVEPNQFVVHLRSFQGGLAASSLRGIASPAYTVLRFKDSKQGVNFWKEFFRSKKFINSLVKVTYGIRDGRTIKVTDLLDLKYRIPSQNLEQCKIGQLINSINKLLTLYENKQQHLTEIKKTLLNTMFI